MKYQKNPLTEGPALSLEIVTPGVAPRNHRLNAPDGARRHGKSPVPADPCIGQA